MDYADRRRLADSWTQRCTRELRAGAWSPTTLERAVAAELCRTARIPSDTPPPFTDRRLRHRLTLLANTAPTYRLALIALGTDSDSASDQVSLANLLSGLLPLAEATEHWNRTHDRLYHLSTAGAEARHRRLGIDDTEEDRRDTADLTREHPGFATNLADAETFFAGFCSVGELFVAIATGDVD
ncbi:hypothetical protein [Nocardia wallacei]|uniref:hypothetical protein n=1 Tax=Nocardia wallacei TaxID=480035 RepID=UPI002456DAB1|nr:hypothetical protein [Nocardia wallacei]